MGGAGWKGLLILSGGGGTGLGSTVAGLGSKGIFIRSIVGGTALGTMPGVGWTGMPGLSSDGTGGGGMIAG